MIPVEQSIVSTTNGNCLAACVASFLEVPLEVVPNFAESFLRDSDAWWWALWGFMAAAGFEPAPLTLEEQAPPGAYVFTVGRSARGVAHVVLFRDGVMVHDPHPSGAGLLTVDDRVMWVCREFAPVPSYLARGVDA